MDGMFGEMKSLAQSFFKMATNGKGFTMCGLCAKYFQPHIAKPVLYDVVDLKLIK